MGLNRGAVRNQGRWCGWDLTLKVWAANLQLALLGPLHQEAFGKGWGWSWTWIRLPHTTRAGPHPGWPDALQQLGVVPRGYSVAAWIALMKGGLGKPLGWSAAVFLLVDRTAGKAEQREQ